MLKDRILVKMVKSPPFLVFQTTEYRNKKVEAKRFYTGETAHGNLLHTGEPYIERDIYSFAEYSLHDGCLRIHFTWLSPCSNGEWKGYSQRVELPESRLIEFLNGEQTEMQFLSKPRPAPNKLRFESGKTLRLVLQNPVVARKFSKFISTFSMKCDETVIYDDFIPYSFGFTCYTGGKRGLNGGIILHDQQNPQKAHYEIHT